MTAKLVAGIAESSLLEEPVQTRYVFLMLIALADPRGEVRGTNAALARRLHLPERAFSKAVERLGRPDPASRTKDLEGRRVVPLEREVGYRVVNLPRLAASGDRRNYMRDYMRRYRSRAKPAVVAPPKTVPEKKPRAKNPRWEAATDVLRHWAKYHPDFRGVETDRNSHTLVIGKLSGEGAYSVDDLKAAIDAMHRDRWYREHPEHQRIESLFSSSDRIARLLEGDRRAPAEGMPGLWRTGKGAPPPPDPLFDGFAKGS